MAKKIVGVVLCIFGFGSDTVILWLSLLGNLPRNDQNSGDVFLIGFCFFVMGIIGLGVSCSDDACDCENGEETEKPAKLPIAE